MNSIENVLNMQRESNKLDYNVLLFSSRYLDSLSCELSKYFKKVYTSNSINNDAFNFILFYIFHEDDYIKLKGIIDVYDNMKVVVFNLSRVDFELNFGKLVYFVDVEEDINFKESITNYIDWIESDIDINNNDLKYEDNKKETIDVDVNMDKKESVNTEDVELVGSKNLDGSIDSVNEKDIDNKDDDLESLILGIGVN